MKGLFLSRPLRIDSPDQAVAFANPKRRRILIAFMGRERSLSEAAAVLDMPLNRLAHHVSSFLRLGLLTLVREQKRAGRPIRYYRAIAELVLIPAEVAHAATGTALAAELRVALAKSDRLAGHEDMILSVDADGRAKITRTGGIEAEACEYWRMLNLSKSEARQLAGEIEALLRSYQAPPGKGRMAYLAHAAVAPRARS